jgi:Uma2 family endonuclease
MTPAVPVAPPVAEPPPLLAEGMRLSREEFHRRYLRLHTKLPDVRAELVQGVVYIMSPMRLPHDEFTNLIRRILFRYEDATPGVRANGSPTTILEGDNEPEPDALLRILPEYGGRSGPNADEYLEGPPELMVEVSVTTQDKDLGPKREAYREAGVREYLVLLVEEGELRAFDLEADEAIPLLRWREFRSRVFPGLRLDAKHLLAGNTAKSLRLLEKGLASPEHAAFVKELRARKAALTRAKRKGTGRKK